jgi:hypothetical protein
MAEQFSYERDVTPLMGNYFKRLQSSGLSPLAQAKLYEAKTQEAQAGFANEAAARTKAMEFEKTRLQLENARRESSSKIGNMQRVTELQSILSNAMSDKVSDDERPKLVSRIGIQYAPLIGTSEVAKTMFTSAQKGVTGSTRKASTDQFQMTKGFMDDLDKVKLAKDYAGKPIDEFEDEGSLGMVSTVIDLYGTPELQAQAAEATAKEKLGIARKIRTDYYKSVMKGQSAPQGTTTQSPRSLYKKSPTVNPLLGTPP